MRTSPVKIKELIYQILGINETEYKLKCIPKNILKSINSIHISLTDIDIILEDHGDDPNAVELLYNIRSEIVKNNKKLIWLWEVADNLSIANLNKDKELLSQLMPYLTKIR